MAAQPPAPRWSSPGSITVDSAGDIYFGDCCSTTVRKIDTATGTVRTVAGGGSSSNDGVPATTQGYSNINAVALDGVGNLYIGDFASRIHKVNVATTTLTFPTSTAVGSLDTTDDPQMAIFSNIGNAPLNGFSGNGTITSFWLVDAASTCFPFSPVVPGASCTVPVDFKPTQSGAPLTGTLTLLDTSLNAQPSTQTIHLVGTATAGTIAAGVLTITPYPISFTTTAGVAAPSQNVTLTNTGTATLGIRAVGISGADQSAFQASLANLCPTIAVGASCNEPVSFVSTTTGSYSASYDITYYPVTGNNSTVISSAPLTGTVSGAPIAQLSPTSLTYTTPANTAAANQTVTLSNPGTATLNIASITLGGTNASSFSIVNNPCGSSLLAGGNCVITVGFPAAAMGSYTATLVLNAPSANPVIQVVLLKAIVTTPPDFTLTATPAAQSSYLGTSVILRPYRTRSPHRAGPQGLRTANGTGGRAAAPHRRRRRV